MNRPPPRIAIASSGLGHVSRGVEAWADDLASALVREGVDVRLYKGGGQRFRPYEQVLSCWQRDAMPARRFLRLMPRRFTWRLGLESAYGVEQATFGLTLVHQLRRHQIELLHVQDPLVAIMCERARRLGIIQTRTILAHGTEESLTFQRKITFLQHLAPWHLDEARYAGAAGAHWVAIPNFIDCDRYAPGHPGAILDELGLPENAMIVLCVAAIKRHHKRVDHLIAEFGRLLSERPDLPAWLVIAGGWEESTNELVELGHRTLGDRVRFLVRFPRTRMPELYRAASLFALTSLKEMMPIAVLEALASGVPCLVHRHPVLEWIVGPGGEGVDMESPSALTSALGHWLADAARRRATAVLAREHCIRQFGQPVVVKQILRYYQHVLDARPIVEQKKRAIA